ncbi:MAG: hypothetical protein AYK23_00765 [Candidatus Proteinoplasmatales archaeon SG8-5]|nr:MAG: hypothetical protein AYK23_00765 [Candidatus Proteinoplasmatales archaeon SG8-5]
MDKSDVHASIARAKKHMDNHDYDKAAQILKDALLLAERSAPGDIKSRLDIMMLLAEVNNILGEWVDALMYFDAVVQTSTDIRFAAIASEALISSGSILSKKGDWDTAMRKFHQAEMLADSERLWGIKGKTLLNMGVVQWRRGDEEEAINLAVRARGIGKEIGDPKLIGSAMALISSVRFDQADYPGAVETNKEALVHFRETSDVLEMSRVLNNLGETYKLMEKYDLAIDQFEEGLNLIKNSGAKRNIGYLLMNMAECHARKGDDKTAKLYANRTEEMVKDQEDAYLQAYLHLVWALIHDLNGKGSSADDEFESAVSMMIGLGIPLDTALFKLDYARSLLKRGKAEKARELFGEAVSLFKEIGSTTRAEQARSELEAVG